MDIKSRLASVTDRGKWARRGASFVTKAKATKAVWFVPQPVETSKKAASGAKKTTNRAAKKTTAAAKKGTAATKTSGTKKVTTPLRRKKT